MGFASFGFQGDSGSGGGGGGGAAGVGTSTGDVSFSSGVSSSSRAAWRFGSGRPKPRLVKMRRPMNSYRSASGKSPDPGFNLFRLNPQHSDLTNNLSSVDDGGGEDTVHGVYSCNVVGRKECFDCDDVGNVRPACLSSVPVEPCGNVGVSVSDDKLGCENDPANGVGTNGVLEDSSFRDFVGEVKVDVGLGVGKLDDAGFVFCASGGYCVLKSDNEGDINPSNVEEVPLQDKHCKSKAEVEENAEVKYEGSEGQDVMFGGDGLHSAKNFGFERNEYADNIRRKNFVFGAGCEKREANASFNVNGGEKQGVFVFGTGGVTNSSSQGNVAAKISDGMAGGLCDDGARVKESRASSISVETFSGVDLPNEFKKLLIRTPKNDTPADKSDASKGAGADDIFIFKSSRDNNVSSTGKSAASQEGSNNTGFLGKNIFTLRSCTKSFGSSVLNVGADADNIVKDAKSNDEKKGEFGSGVSSNGLGSSDTDSKAPFFNIPLSFSVNLSHGLNRKADSSVKSRLCKGQKSKKKRGKLAPLNTDKVQSAQEPFSHGSNPAETEDSPQCYSPMDVSPRTTTSTDSHIVETSASTNGPPFMETTADAQSVTSSIGEDGELSAAHTQSTAPCMSSTVGVTSGETGVTARSNMSVQNDEGEAQSCTSNLAVDGSELFAFTASSSSESHVTPIRCRGKKYGLKGHLSGASSATQDPSQNRKPSISRLQDENDNSSVSEIKEKHRSAASEEEGNLPELTSAEKACDKWRSSGNQAYKNGKLAQAEDLYTWGINCIPSGKMPDFNGRPLVLCYNNRAVTRMALGKVRDALEDCLLAVACDPDFLKARMRAGNCHLMLGEVELAMQHFNICLESGSGVCLDRQLMFAASEGLQKGQKVRNHINHSAELVKLRTFEGATDALNLITEALLISPHSEKLLEMKAQALCSLRRCKEAVRLCEQTLTFAEKNFVGALPEELSEGSKDASNVRSWRQDMASKCHFHLGKFEFALGALQKQGYGTKDQELLHPLAAIIHQLQKHKNAGNEAFQSGRHAEAIVHYTSAISNSIESRPFAAICFCNRAAVYQALGQITDAIADCSLAMALDENYPKAVSRRATLHEMIRDYEQAADDLQKLISILEKKAKDREESGSKNDTESRQAYRRLSTAESETKKGIPLDLYLILGVKRSDPAPEIKKAYRKAALRHHPDKAAQSLVRSESGEDGQHWKDLADLVHKDSDKLFKKIGEAYQVLSNPDKRSEYDLTEDMRKKETNIYKSSPRRESNGNSTCSPFTRSSSRRHSYRSYYWAYDYY